MFSVVVVLIVDVSHMPYIFLPTMFKLPLLFSEAAPPCNFAGFNAWTYKDGKNLLELDFQGKSVRL